MTVGLARIPRPADYVFPTPVHILDHAEPFVVGGRFESGRARDSQHRIEGGELTLHRRVALGRCDLAKRRHLGVRQGRQLPLGGASHVILDRAATPTEAWPWGEGRQRRRTIRSQLGGTLRHPHDADGRRRGCRNQHQRGDRQPAAHRVQYVAANKALVNGRRRDHGP